MMGIIRTIGGVTVANHLVEKTSEFSPFISFNFIHVKSRTTAMSCYILPDGDKEVTYRHKRLSFVLTLDNDNLELWRANFRSKGHSSNVDLHTRNYVKRELRKYVSEALAELPVDPWSLRRSLAYTTARVIQQTFNNSATLTEYLSAHNSLSMHVKSIDFRIERGATLSKGISLSCHRAGWRRSTPVRQVTQVVFKPFDPVSHVLTNLTGAQAAELQEPDEELFACLYTTLSRKSRELLEVQAINNMRNL